MKYLLLMLMLLVSPLAAEETTLDDFMLLTRHLQTAMSNQEDYSLNASADDLLTRISEVTRVRDGERLFMVDLRWVAGVGEAMATESADARRRLLFVNLVDTLNGLQNEFRTTYAENAVSRQEMVDALDRAIARTSEIKLSGDAVWESGLEWCGRSGIVAGQPGEAISLISVAPSEEGGAGGSVRGGTTSAGTGSGGMVPGFGTSAHSGGGVGTAGSSGGGGHHNTGFSAAGSAVGSVGTSRSSQGSSSHAAGSVQMSNVSKPPDSTRPVAAGQQSTAVKPSAPAYSRPSTPPPPPKKPQPFRPPPRPKKTPPTGTANFMLWLMTVAVIVGFVVIFFLIIRNTRKKIAGEQSKMMLEEKRLPPERLRSESIYENAMNAAEKGNYSEAIRLLTIGSLILLETRSAISYQDSLTNGEYLRRLMMERELHSLFAAPMALFDRLIYGFQSPGKKDFELFKAFYLDLEKLRR